MQKGLYAERIMLHDSHICPAPTQFQVNLDGYQRKVVMNKKIIISMGLPMVIQSSDGRKATLELNEGDFVVCRYHPNNTVYLQDANLRHWYPLNRFRKMVYHIKRILLEGL